MEKLIFCLQCKSPLIKIKPIAEDMLVVQKSLVNYPKLIKNKDEILLFNQWKCKCGNNIITTEYE